MSALSYYDRSKAAETTLARLADEAYAEAGGHYGRAEQILNAKIEAHPHRSAIHGVMLHNATLEALRRVREKDNRFLKESAPVPVVQTAATAPEGAPAPRRALIAPRYQAPVSRQALRVVSSVSRESNSLLDLRYVDNGVRLGDASLQTIARLAGEAQSKAKGHLKNRRFYRGILALAGDQPPGAKVRDVVSAQDVETLNSRVYGL